MTTSAEWPFHPFADIFPLMDEAALAELADDIKANGLREAIKLFDDAIIDGRNRYLACGLAGIEPTFQEIPFAGEQAALTYVLSRNLKRRHLTLEQRALVAARVANMRQGARTDLASADALATGGAPVSQAQAAEFLHVSRSSVQRAQTVLKAEDSELIDAVEAGRVSLARAVETVRPRRVEHGPEPWGGPPVRGGDTHWPVTSLPQRISHQDISLWLVTASDAERRWMCDEAFDLIRSSAERMKHVALVRAWLDKLEQEIGA